MAVPNNHAMLRADIFPQPRIVVEKSGEQWLPVLELALMLASSDGWRIPPASAMLGLCDGL